MNAIAGESGVDTETTRRTEQRESRPPDERGRLTVDDRVVEKVAGHAVTLITDAAAAPRRVLGVKVRWPKPVQKVADEVRERIRSEVSAITGVRVDHVDVEVVAMTLSDSARRVI
jgi:uncharacterized alkaline shock family protein YloU